jgi:hypothetical protein
MQSYDFTLYSSNTNLYFLFLLIKSKVFLLILLYFLFKLNVANTAL